MKCNECGKETNNGLPCCKECLDEALDFAYSMEVEDGTIKRNK